MNSIFYLLKVQLLSTFGINKLLHTKDAAEKRKARWTGIGIGALSILFIGISFLYNAVIASFLKSMGILELYLPMAMSITSLIILLTTLYKVNGVLFECKDYDIIMALPIKTSYIVASRVFYLYLMNVLFLAIIMIPAAIIYAILARPSFIFYLIYIITLFFIPLIPIIIATFIGAGITMITLRFKRTNLVSILLNSIFIIGIMSISFSSQSVSVEGMEQISQILMDSINKIYPLAGLYLKAASGYNLWAILLFIGSSVFVFGLFATLLGKKFKEINTLIHTTFSSSQYEVGEMKVSSALMALYHKEFKRYFSSSIYVMNTGVGVLFMFMLTGSLFFLDATQLEQILGIPHFGRYVAEFAPFIVAFFNVMNCTTACAISLEGKNLWILKSCPVDAKTIFLSKIGVQLTVTIPAIFINGILMTIALKVGFMQMLLIWIVPMIYTVFIAIIGIMINLKWPKLEWTNEVAVIKQSIGTLLTMVVGILSIVIPGGLVFVIPGLSTISKTIILSIVMGIITYIAYRYMNKKGEKIFRAL